MLFRFFFKIYCGLKNRSYLCSIEKENLSVAMHEPCGVNLKDFFYPSGSIAVIEY